MNEEVDDAALGLAQPGDLVEQRMWVRIGHIGHVSLQMQP